MTRPAVLLACAALLASVCVAHSSLVATDIANHPFSTDFAPGGRLRLRVRSGDVHIIGTSEKRISVAISGASADESRRLKVRFERGHSGSALRIRGGSRNDLTITIRIPSDTDLYARIPFGEVHVKNVTRSQDVELHAGDLTVEMGDADDYAHVDASVFTGDLDAVPFHEWRSGLFRTFRTTGSGRYRLHAHVGAGQLTLQSRARAGSASLRVVGSDRIIL